MARIKHIAIRTPYPEKTAAFYKDVLGLKEVGQARAGESPRDAAGYTGIHHLGFMVDDVADACRKLDAAGATPMTNRTDVRHSATAGPRSYYEIKYRGPDNQEIDVTETGWIGPE